MVMAMEPLRWKSGIRGREPPRSGLLEEALKLRTEGLICPIMLLGWTPPGNIQGPWKIELY